MKEILISIKSVCKEYKIKEKVDTSNIMRAVKAFIIPKYRRISALTDISFDIYEGDIVGYIGQNGAGKSTTIKLLLGLIAPTSGTVKVFDKNPMINRMNQNKEIGVLSGTKSQLWWELPLIDSFKFIQRIYEVNSIENDQWLEYLIDKLEVRSFINQPVRQLSLGQRMKGEFICTFLHHPKIVFLDEPTIGIDVITKQKILEFLVDINSKDNTTIFFTTHDLDDIEKICNRMLLLNKGKIEYDGEITSFLNNYDSIKKLIVYSKDLSKLADSDYIKIISKNKEFFEIAYDSTKFNNKEICEYIYNFVEVESIRFSQLDLTSVLRLRSSS